jgi:hypothetical protein
MQQRFAVRLVERCFERWKDRMREMDAIKERADQVVVARGGKVVVRCWDSWVRTAELRSAEREVSERVGARVVRESMAFWRRRTCAHGHKSAGAKNAHCLSFSAGMNTRGQAHFMMPLSSGSL